MSHPDFTPKGATHLELNQAQLRRKYNSTGDFRSQAACGNGSYHATKTPNLKAVNCQTCLEWAKANPGIMQFARR